VNKTVSILFCTLKGFLYNNSPFIHDYLNYTYYLSYIQKYFNLPEKACIEIDNFPKQIGLSTMFLKAHYKGSIKDESKCIRYNR